MNLILFGFKGCGKTTFGKKIASRLNRSFIDTDDCVEKLYFHSKGKQLSCRQIFKTLGTEAFRRLEWNVLQQLKSTQNAIIAVGGSLVLHPENVSILAKLGQLVYLKVIKETLKKQILSQTELPAFLDAADPEGSFEKMYQERLVKYEEIHALSLDLEAKTQDQILLELCALIQDLENTHG